MAQVLKSELCDSVFLTTLREMHRTGRVIRSNVVIDIDWKNDEWHVDFSNGFLPIFDLEEAVDVTFVRMSQKSWFLELRLKSDEGLRSCVRAVERSCALPETC